MSSSKPSIEKVKARHEGRLLLIEGVEGVGIGEESQQPFLRVYVAKKTKSLQKKIPTRIEGYPVRIEGSGEFHALPK